MGNDYEKVDIDAIDVTFSTTEEPKTATLERVWLYDPAVRRANGAAQGDVPDLPRRGDRAHGAD